MILLEEVGVDDPTAPGELDELLVVPDDLESLAVVQECARIAGSTSQVNAELGSELVLPLRRTAGDGILCGLVAVPQDNDLIADDSAVHRLLLASAHESSRFIQPVENIHRAPSS